MLEAMNPIWASAAVASTLIVMPACGGQAFRVATSDTVGLDATAGDATDAAREDASDAAGDSGADVTNATSDGAPEASPGSDAQWVPDVIEEPPSHCAGGFACAAAVPNGWSGPMELYAGGATPPTACGTNFEGPVYAGGNTPTADDAMCDCKCQAAQNVQCSAIDISFYGGIVGSPCSAAVACAQKTLTPGSVYTGQRIRRLRRQYGVDTNVGSRGGRRQLHAFADQDAHASVLDGVRARMHIGLGPRLQRLPFRSNMQSPTRDALWKPVHRANGRPLVPDDRLHGSSPLLRGVRRHARLFDMLVRGRERRELRRVSRRLPGADVPHHVAVHDRRHHVCCAGHVRPGSATGRLSADDFHRERGKLPSRAGHGERRREPLRSNDLLLPPVGSSRGRRLKGIEFVVATVGDRYGGAT
jgi:hypothetical protein